MWALIGGVIAIVIGIVLVGPAGWGWNTLRFLAGGLVVLLFLGGLVAIASGISDIKDQLAEKKEKEEEKGKKESAPGPGAPAEGGQPGPEKKAEEGSGEKKQG